MVYKNDNIRCFLANFFLVYYGYTLSMIFNCCFFFYMQLYAHLLLKSITYILHQLIKDGIYISMILKIAFYLQSFTCSHAMRSQQHLI